VVATGDGEVISEDGDGEGDSVKEPKLPRAGDDGDPLLCLFVFDGN